MIFWIFCEKKFYSISNYVLSHNLEERDGNIEGSAMRVGIDTFGDPIFQKGLEN